MLILGINAYHGDSSACLLRDGRIVAAAEEERFRRLKHWAGFPSEAIRYCLGEARARLSDLDHVALNQDSGANLRRKIFYSLRHRPQLAMLAAKLRTKRRRNAVEADLQSCFSGERLGATVHRVEHHLAHLASAFLVSPFSEAVIASIDGFGDFSSGAWGCGRVSEIQVDGRVLFPHSLGVFYETITRHLGFPNYGDEYKVMGLAPYGKPSRLRAMREIVHLLPAGDFELDLAYFRHHREHVSYEWENGVPTMGALSSPLLADLLGPPRDPGAEITQAHRDIARSAQAMYEEALFHLLNRLHDRYRLGDLALSGGCAMNSVANGKVHAHTPFRRLYVPAAAGDAGGAIGAALVAHGRASAGAPAPRQHMDHAYWGPGFDAAAMDAALAARRDEVDAACEVSIMEDQADLCRSAAAAIAEGRIVGWLQGRMEWGPRALGNRSILADPRRADIREILNRKIKRRESFRPFAPSILREAVADWFEWDADVPFMMQVYPIRDAKRALVPAVTHVDGTGRLQTVTRAANPIYYTLIEEFARITGVPLVLNTSFNENEPVVCRPEEALDCFLRTRMDVLVLGTRYIARRSDPDRK